MRKKPKITACMMIKNEERNLDRCLLSIKDFVDEIVIVDTGSTDQSISIAKAYGAKVYEHPWRNDFSLHRNQSISYAPEDTDFVLIIDADEELVYTAEMAVIRQDLKDLPKDFNALALTMEDWQNGRIAMKNNSTRIFRRGSITYENIVHNKPRFEGQLTVYPAITLRHYGYDLTPEKREAKRKRTVGLLEERLAKNPKDFECYFYLGQIYSTLGDHKKSLECNDKYIQHKKEIGKINKTAYFTATRACMVLEKRDKAVKLIHEALEEFPEDLDLNMILVEVGGWLNQSFFIEKGGEQFLRTFDKYQRDHTTMEGNFVFSYNYEALAYVIHSLAMVKLTQGLNQINNMKMVLPFLEDPFKSTYVAHANLSFDKLNMPHLKKMIEPDDAQLKNIKKDIDNVGFNTIAPVDNLIRENVAA